MHRVWLGRIDVGLRRHAVGAKGLGEHPACPLARTLFSVTSGGEKLAVPRLDQVSSSVGRGTHLSAATPSGNNIRAPTRKASAPIDVVTFARARFQALSEAGST
jgi:hypothetical protein